MTTQELRELAPNKGYNLAVEVPLNQPTNDLEPLRLACPVLAEAAGALGVLRAMETRRQGIQKRMYLDGGQHRIWHLIYVQGEPAALYDYRFTLDKV